MVRPSPRSLVARSARIGNMLVLITGASGFLGARVTDVLAREHDVVAMGRSFTASRRTELMARGVELLGLDLADPAQQAELNSVLDRVDAVVHCAALSTLWGQWEDLLRINVDATAQLASGCARRGIRLVHISSPSIYNRAVAQDSTLASRPIPETLPVGPRFDSNYARSKWLGEQAVLREHPSACVLRPRGIYGPGDTSILPRVVAALRAGRLPRLVSGEVLTDLTHVNNAAHAVALALEAQVAGPVNIADGTPTAVWAGIDQVADALGVPRPRRRVPAGLVEVAAAGGERIARLLGRSEPRLTATGVRLLTRGMRLDLTRARDELGYLPVHTDGLAATIGELA